MAAALDLSSNQRVFIVDDDLDTLTVMSVLFESLGANVTLCSESTDAARTYGLNTRADKPFDLIVLDIRMPRMNGYELAAELKAQGHKGMIVAFTANVTGRGRRVSKEGSFDYYFSKGTFDKNLAKALLGQCKDFTEGKIVDF